MGPLITCQAGLVEWQRATELGDRIGKATNQRTRKREEGPAASMAGNRV